MRVISTAVFLVAATFFGLPAASAAVCPASSFVQSAGSAFIGAARNGSPGAFVGVASRYADLNGIALFALGPHRAQLQKSQQGEYVSLTRNFIGRFMSENASRLASNGLTVTDCAGSGNALTVGTRTGNGKRIIFKVYKTRSGYRVRDVNVSSYWLAQQLRSKFTSVIRSNNGDIGALFAYLRN